MTSKIAFVTGRWFNVTIAQPIIDTMERRGYECVLYEKAGPAFEDLVRIPYTLIGMDAWIPLPAKHLKYKDFPELLQAVERDTRILGGGYGWISVEMIKRIRGDSANRETPILTFGMFDSYSDPEAFSRGHADFFPEHHTRDGGATDYVRLDKIKDENALYSRLEALAQGEKPAPWNSERFWQVYLNLESTPYNRLQSALEEARISIKE